MVEHSTLRKMTQIDVLRVHEIDVSTDPTPWSEKLISDCQKVGYDCWVLVDQQNILGFGILNYGANEAHILKLAIEPSQQGKGLGKKLLQHLIALAKVKEMEEVYLEVRVSNDKAIGLYKSHHFVEVGVRKGYYPANEATSVASEDALTMALPLW